MAFYKNNRLLGKNVYTYRPIREKALDISREIGDRENEGCWLGNIGLTYVNLGQIEKAMVYYEKALNISREIGDRENEGSWLGHLGSAYAELGQIEKAILHYEKADRSTSVCIISEKLINLSC